MTSIDTQTVHSISSERSGGLENDGSAQGFDNQIKAVAFVALALVVLVRPRELNFLRLLPFILPLFLTSLYLASRTVAGLRSVRVPFSVVVMVFWFVTTTAWSGARKFSVAESIVIICVAGMASLVASFCSLRALVGGVMAGCLAVLVMSIAVGAAFPAYGLVSDPYEGGSLQGIMLDRNSLAFVLLLGLVATLAFEFRGRWARMHKIILGAFLFGGVLSTKSATCLILAVVAILMAVALALPRRVAPARRGWALVAVTLPVAATIPYLTAHLDQLYELVGRDSTLTGRTQIWPAVRQVIAIQPWLGQGWGAVWAPVPLHRLINRSVGFEVPHSHNGYLDAQVQVGAIGLALLLLVLLFVAVRGMAFYLKSDSPLSSWAPILTVVLLIDNRVETTLAAPATLFLLVATLVVLGRTKRLSAGDGCPVQQTADAIAGEPHGNRSVPVHRAGRASSGLIADS